MNTVQLLPTTIYRLSPYFFSPLLISLLLVSVCLADNSKESLREYQVKAALIGQFLKYVQWPDTYSLDLGENLTIGIVGEDPFGDFLDKTLSGRTVDGRGLSVQRFAGIKNIKPVHVLIVNNKRLEDRLAVLKKTKDLKMLTIGDGAEFLDAGGIIAFIFQNNTRKVRYQLNMLAARSKNLQIYPRLASWADRVIE